MKSHTRIKHVLTTVVLLLFLIQDILKKYDIPTAIYEKFVNPDMAKVCYLTGRFTPICCTSQTRGFVCAVRLADVFFLL